MAGIRILLVDDHQGFLNGLRGFLGGFPDMEVVGVASSGADGLAEARLLRPDVVLVDWTMPDLNGLQVLALLKKDAAAPRVVIVTMMPDHPAYLNAAMALGADGFLCKSDVDHRLVPMLRRLFARPAP